MVLVTLCALLAGVMRSLLQDGPLVVRMRQQPCRLWYTGPMFRYERPQRGRHRQFHQLGVELVGGPDLRQAAVQADVEVLEMAHHFLRELGVQVGGPQVALQVNSLGSLTERGEYSQLLHAYLVPFRDRLSPDSRHRWDWSLPLCCDNPPCAPFVVM